MTDDDDTTKGGCEQAATTHDNGTCDDWLESANAELAMQGRGGLSARLASPAKSSKNRQHSQPWLIGSDQPAPTGIAQRTLAPETLNQLRLSMIPGVGPRIMSELLEQFGTAGDVLAASASELGNVRGVGPKLCQQIKLESRNFDLDAVVDWCQRHDTQILVRGQAGYPKPLLDLDDAPPILFCRGELCAADDLAVAIVGTRHATNYGLQQTERLAYSLSRAGVTVVSGLARGIDAAAHEGALSGGGRTIAVLGGGLAQMYPPEHEGLAAAIAADGAVLSEHPPMTKTRGGLFPQRNRIVAGLALGIIVMEAPDRSGALITARLAGEQNRDVMALPGPVNSRASAGCHQLIREGAVLIRHVDDVLELIGPLRNPITQSQDREVRNPTELQLNELEQQVLQSIPTVETPIDSVITASELPAHRVIAVLSVLEMRRLIKRFAGQKIIRL